VEEALSRQIGGLSAHTPPVRIAPDPDAAARALAEHLASLAERAIVERGRFTLAVSGGKTPAVLYLTLAREPYRHAIEWDRVELFLVDERRVPPEDSKSNYRLLRDTLLSGAAIPDDQVHRWKSESLVEAALSDYETQLREILLPGAESKSPPSFDLILLGLGSDGHTASLFPGTPALEETHRWVAAGTAPEAPVERLTMTLPLINAAREVAFLATGEEKAPLVKAILSGEGSKYPAWRVHPVRGELLWFLDAAAGRNLAGGNI
jgi:6-phosphogluconolactonase